MTAEMAAVAHVNPESPDLGAANRPLFPGYDSTGEKIEDLPDRPLTGGGLGDREVRLDLVAIPPAVLGLDQVAGGGEVGHDPVSSALGDAQAGRNVANAHVGVVGNAEQCPSVVGQEIPSSHNK
jgi:hypothetical protein